MLASQLHLNQLQDVFFVLLQGKIIRVIRIIRECGRSRVPWIHFVTARGDRRATFISFRELNLAFLRYLAELDRLSATFAERLALSRAMYILLQPGDCVFKWNCDNQLGVVVEKTLGKGKIAQVWVDWGDRVPMIEQPFLLEIF